MALLTVDVSEESAGVGDASCSAVSAVCACVIEKSMGFLIDKVCSKFDSVRAKVRFGCIMALAFHA